MQGRRIKGSRGAKRAGEEQRGREEQRELVRCKESRGGAVRAGEERRKREKERKFI